MSITNPPMEELENDETEEGVTRGENFTESKNIMGDI